MPRNPTGKQIEASRLNGAKSHGPTTSQGKQVASLNAYKHGRYALFPCLVDADDEAAYATFVRSYYGSFQPANDAEIQLIDIGQCRNLAALFPGREYVSALDRHVAATVSIDERTPVLRHLSQEINRLTTRRASHLRQLLAQQKARRFTEMPHQDLPPVDDRLENEIPKEPENDPQLPADQSDTAPEPVKFEPENPTPKLPHSPIARRLHALANRRPRMLPPTSGWAKLLRTRKREHYNSASRARLGWPDQHRLCPEE
jgi:hypothetical protein